MPVAWLAPAHKPDPFQMIKAVSLSRIGSECSQARMKKMPTESQGATAQMASSDSVA